MNGHKARDETGKGTAATVTGSKFMVRTPQLPGHPGQGSLLQCGSVCVCNECAPRYSVARKKQTIVRFTRCYALCTMLCDKTNKIVMCTTRIMSAVVQEEKYIILIWPKSRSIVADWKTTKLKEKNQ